MFITGVFHAFRRDYIEEERINNSWIRYWNKNQPQLTAEDFKNYLTEDYGLTEEQINEINISAVFVDNNINNFEEFIDEIVRVTKI